MNQAIGQRGLAVVDVGNNGEVADVIHKPAKRSPSIENERVNRGSHKKGSARGRSLPLLWHFSRFYGLFSGRDGYPLRLIVANHQQCGGTGLVQLGNNLGVLRGSGDGKRAV